MSGLEAAAEIWHNLSMTIELPEYAHVVRNLGPGMHPYRNLLPRLEESPVAQRIETEAMPLGPLMDSARVLINDHEGFCFVDIKIPAIVLSEHYYANGKDIDLYLDMAHELAHLRQFHEGRDLWDHSLHYVDRPTEIEGYAVAVEEGLRLGMTEDEIRKHLANPWLSSAEVARLRNNIERFLANGMDSQNRPVRRR
ncbi:MAG TPA: hypothetical protein VLL97_14910 [Acidobacteriota bacterium]|nr:hypothetical protein [Acidobacteriota bacterium]